MIELTTYLKVVLEVAGLADIFEDTQPTDQPNCIMIMQVDGGPPSRYLGQRESLHNPYIQVLVRNTSAAEADMVINKVKEVLEKYHDDTIQSALMRGDIMTLGRDSLGRMEKMLNFILIVKE